MYIHRRTIKGFLHYLCYVNLAFLLQLEKERKAREEREKRDAEEAAERQRREEEWVRKKLLPTQPRSQSPRGILTLDFFSAANQKDLRPLGIEKRDLGFH